MDNHYLMQKYMEHAPDWEIEGYVPTRGISDGHYMPENADYVEPDDELDVAMVLKCISASLGIAVLLTAAVILAH